MPHHTPSAIEIDRKLRDDFRRRLRDYGVSAEAVDPILSVLFRSFATQIESVYAETSRIRLALLDELIAGLGIEPRMARPAQTIVRFLAASDKGTVVIPEGTGLLGEAQSGERLNFSTDATVAVSGARIAAAFAYQDGNLRLLPGHEMPDEFQNSRPSLEPVRAPLGAGSALYLAIEGLAPEHLSRHSFYFEFGPDAIGLEKALANEPWCLVGNDGELSSKGILRPHSGNAGLRSLEWLVRKNEPETGEREYQDARPWLPPGFYGSRVFVLPDIEPERMFQCVMPRRFEAVLPRLFGREAASLFSHPRAWLRVSFPGDCAPLASGIGSVFLHAITASNVECLNQTFHFESQGTMLPIGSNVGVSTYLVAPLSILGETGSEMGAAYLPDQTPSSDPRVGRYKLQHQRLELRPALRPDGAPEAYANVRLWMTNGALGNTIGPGRIQSTLKAPGFNDVRVLNPVSATGGTNGETLEQALDRFQATLLTRDRIVTEPDLEAIVRAFDRRIVRVTSKTGLRRTTTGLQRVQQLKLQLDYASFVDPDIESRILVDELEQKLREGILYGTEIALEASWV
ncbi:MAG TPA: hypothetical protein VKX25_18730 [Bryobacteraceae bacterium]|jgi:hypothetical protein|nr:hypothetical protein [Bryobacteraceae bacterium]